LLGSEFDLFARMLREFLARLLALDFIEGSLRLILREPRSAAHVFASGLRRLEMSGLTAFHRSACSFSRSFVTRTRTPSASARSASTAAGIPASFAVVTNCARSFASGGVGAGGRVHFFARSMRTSLI